MTINSDMLGLYETLHTGGQLNLLPSVEMSQMAATAGGMAHCICR